MAAPARTYTWDHVLSTTADKIHKSGAVQDAISSSNPTFNEFMTKGRIKKKTVGGDQIAINLMYEHNSTIDSYSGYDTLDVSPQDGITRAYVPWAQYAGAVSISGIQRFKNMGKEQIVDLLKEKMRQTTAGWSERLNKDLWASDDATGTIQTGTHPYTGNGGKNIISIPIYIQALAAATAAHDLDIGGIDQSTYTWWKNQIVDGVGMTTAALLKKGMSNAYNLCSQGPGGSPDLIMMDQVTYELYESAMQDQIRYSYSDNASAGFENMHFKGAKVMWDGYVPDYELGTDGVLVTGSALTNGSIVFINTNTMSLYVGRDHDWKPRGFMTPVDQDASTSLYLCYLQLICDNRRKNGAIFDVPTAFS